MKHISAALTCALLALLVLSACGPARVSPVEVPISTTAPSNPTSTLAGPTSTALPTTADPEPTSTIRLTSTPRPSATPTQTYTPWPADSPSLRSLAEQRGFFIGAAVQSGFLNNEAAYRETFRREFNMLTAEWEMKMCAVWPERDRWDFQASDNLVQFAQDNGMVMRGHTLIWTECVPQWLYDGTFSENEAKDILREYITTVVGRYKGKIAVWDVINESVERPPIWHHLIGPEYAALAFQWAHEADPDALLYYNDYGAEVPGAKFEAMYQFLQELQAQGTPIHGVGFQFHIGGMINPALIAQNFDRIHGLGLEVQITEFDLPAQYVLRNAHQQQADIYADVLRVCLEAENCTAFVAWGFTDKYTWLVDHLKRSDPDPLIFDANYQPKPVYEALHRVLQEP
jgi:endo-1,4-beta-xylanase